jgi:hypothetical protein
MPLKVYVFFYRRDREREGTEEVTLKMRQVVLIS